jgi:hypothetical protein
MGKYRIAFDAHLMGTAFVRPEEQQSVKQRAHHRGLLPPRAVQVIYFQLSTITLFPPRIEIEYTSQLSAIADGVVDVSGVSRAAARIAGDHGPRASGHITQSRHHRPRRTPILQVTEFTGYCVLYLIVKQEARAQSCFQPLTIFASA